MPEIIEIKIYADFIKKYCKNHKLQTIKINKGRYKTHGPFLNYKKMINNCPLKLLNVGSKGKFTYLSFDNDYNIGVTLGLTGGWFYKKKNTENPIHGMPADRFNDVDVEKWEKNGLNHLNLEFIFENGSLYFYDILSYGTIKIFNKEELKVKLDSIGLDFMDKNITGTIFMEKLYKPIHYDKYIGNILMNQKLVSGVGNYLRADSLWLAKISPFRKVKDITTKEYELLFYSIRLLVWGTYDYKKGLKLKYIKKSDKLPFHYNTDFFVYGRKIDIFNNQVTREALHDGTQVRNIYWAKKHQK